jgi:hypothetical protein
MTGVLKLYPRDMRDTPAKEKINKLIESVAGEISSPDGSLDITGEMGVAFLSSGTAALHTAVGYENKRVIIKSTGGSITVILDGSEKIDDVTQVMLSEYEAVELISDGVQWWIMSSHVTIKDTEILEQLKELLLFVKIMIRHMEEITDQNFKEGDTKK